MLLKPLITHNSSLILLILHATVHEWCLPHEREGAQQRTSQKTCQTKNLVTTLSGRKAIVLIVFATPEVACSFSTILVPGSQSKRSKHDMSHKNY